VLGRTLDSTYAEAIRRDISTVTAARLCTTALFRYVGPFLAVVARGLDVSVAELGVALTIAQVSGFAAPLIGRIVDRLPRRTSILIGLGGTAGGGFVAAASTGIVWFTAGLLAIGTFNLVLVVGAGSWIADHVPFAQRSRVVGLNETSWALGLLVGVSTMGLVTAVSSWRWGYVAGALATLGALAVSARRLDTTASTAQATTEASNSATGVWRIGPAGWLAVLGVVALLAASEALFVTFGPWLQDEFGVGDATLAAATFGLGAIELAASGLSMTRTDRWGKERSVAGGATVMIAAALIFLAVDQWALPGMLMVALFIGSFEFSIVSAIPIGGELVIGRPAHGLGLLMAATTIGRAITTIPTTWLYDRRGIAASAMLAIGWAAAAMLAMRARHRLVSRGSRW
jgi:MFS transporter, DHA1 family, inner membrane transport protein